MLLRGVVAWLFVCLMYCFKVWVLVVFVGCLGFDLGLSLIGWVV